MKTKHNFRFISIKNTLLKHHLCSTIFTFWRSFFSRLKNQHHIAFNLTFIF